VGLAAVLKFNKASATLLANGKSKVKSEYWHEDFLQQ
jgi:hypothetical protein